MRDTIVAYEKARKKKRRRTVVETDSSGDESKCKCVDYDKFSKIDD